LGLFDKIFGNRPKQPKTNAYFQTLDAYTPAFTTMQGGIYEMELTRAAIHSFATHVSKLKPTFYGSVYQSLGKKVAFEPNDFMDTSKFLYRLATILSVNTTAFIIPIYGDDMITIKGYYPVLPRRTEVIDVGGEAYLRYTFANGNKAAIELDKVGILTQYQYQNDLFGDGNQALKSTLSLVDIQQQGMEDAIKQSARIRFMAKLGTVQRPEDIEAEKKRFSRENLSADNDSGVMMFDSKYSNIKQIDSKPFLIDKDQMEQIHKNVYNYFGVNEDILQNKFDEDTWNSFYEGKIEPFALQLGLVMTNMTFTKKEKAHGNYITWTSSRLRYASNKTKLEISSQLFDRGVFSRNDVLALWGMDAEEDGHEKYIRKEYTQVGRLGEEDDNASETNKGISNPSNNEPDTGEQED